MIDNTLVSQQMIVQSNYGRSESDIQSQQQAERLFQNSFNQARRNRVWSALRRNARQLWHLHPSEPVVQLRENQRERVSIAQIKGSAGGRSWDFDAEFRPLVKHNRNRWVQVASALFQGKRLPPVQLLRLDDTYFVVDGHHRISVASALGETEIEARVTDGMIRPIR